MTEEEFWGWCGFVNRGHSYSGKELWVSPEDIEWFDKCIRNVDKRGYARMPEKDSYYALPQIDLNNLFKYAVPKIEKPQISFYFDNTSWSVEVRVISKSGGIIVAGGLAPDPAQALFGAICKVIEGEK
jgi:hypothetical protein